LCTTKRKKVKKQVVEIHSVAKVLIAELQNQEPFFCQFERYRCLLSFPDHHNFTEKRHFKLKFSSKKKIIITTEKIMYD
jgi:tetraacyldisaccharide 4'-kinase